MATGFSGKGDRRTFNPKYRTRPFKNCPTARYLPGSDARPEEVFTFPFLVDDNTIDYITKNKKIMFIIRGPSGTGKTTLSAMISETYPEGIVCSADNYFSQAFVDKSRSKENLKESHEFCQRRVKQECEKGTHPIIVQNTHIKRWEMGPYLDMAAEHGYNVILAVTLRKFKVSAEILAQTNKKGLKEEYFQVRLNQWQECIPIYTGWFFGHDDSNFVLNEVKKGLELLLGDLKFCSAMNAFSEDEIWKRYYVESPLFCVAAYTDCGKSKSQWNYYVSEEVQEVYSKCFHMEIIGMVVTKCEIILLVDLTDEMKSLAVTFDDPKPEADNVEDLLSNAFSNLNMRSRLNELKIKSKLDEKFPSNGSTTKLVDWDDGDKESLINIRSTSIVHVGKIENADKLFKSSEEIVGELFSDLVDCDGFIDDVHFDEFNDGTKYIRLAENGWFLRLPTRIGLDSFFSGLYCV